VACCGWSQAPEPAFSLIGFLVNRLVLTVGDDQTFQFPPQVILRVQLGTLFGQP